MATDPDPPGPGSPAEEAIPALVALYGGRIYGLGLRLCGSEADAEDLVQETFLSAYRRWSDFAGAAAPSTWLFTIAVRACRRMHRRRAGEPHRLETLAELLPAAEETVPALPGAAEQDPFADRLRREAYEAVARALPAVPVAFRLPLVLKDLADFSIAEVAQVLGLKEATVKTRVHRGRLALRRALAEALPRREAPAPDHDRQVCLDLLQAKLEAMDRGVGFPLAREELCSRCESLFATLDLARDACLELGRGTLPPPVADLLAAGLPAAERASRRPGSRRAATAG